MFLVNCYSILSVYNISPTCIYFQGSIPLEYATFSTFVTKGKPTDKGRSHGPFGVVQGASAKAETWVSVPIPESIGNSK